MMFKEAEARGATIMQGVATRALRNVDGSLRGIVMRRPDGTEEEIETRVVLDCSEFHPERPPLWAPDSPVEGTEEWIGLGRGSRNRSRCNPSCAPIAGQE